jgi:hypothetical protein
MKRKGRRDKYHRFYNAIAANGYARFWHLPFRLTAERALWMSSTGMVEMIGGTNIANTTSTLYPWLGLRTAYYQLGQSGLGLAEMSVRWEVFNMFRLRVRPRVAS